MRDNPAALRNTGAHVHISRRSAPSRGSVANLGQIDNLTIDVPRASITLFHRSPVGVEHGTRLSQILRQHLVDAGRWQRRSSLLHIVLYLD